MVHQAARESNSLICQELSAIPGAWWARDLYELHLQSLKSCGAQGLWRLLFISVRKGDNQARGILSTGAWFSGEQVFTTDACASSPLGNKRKGINSGSYKQDEGICCQNWYFLSSLFPISLSLWRSSPQERRDRHRTGFIWESSDGTKHWSFPFGNSAWLGLGGDTLWAGHDVFIRLKGIFLQARLTAHLVSTSTDRYFGGNRAVRPREVIKKIIDEWTYQPTLSCSIPNDLVGWWFMSSTFSLWFPGQPQSQTWEELFLGPIIFSGIILPRLRLLPWARTLFPFQLLLEKECACPRSPQTLV